MIQKKPWYLSKTLLLAALQGVLGVLTAALAENPDLSSIGYILIMKSILDVILRALTMEPII